MVDLEDESDAAIRRRIEAELAAGRQPSAVLRGLVADGAERERAAGLLREVLEPAEPEPASPEPEPERASGGINWMVLVGAGVLLLGIVATLVTGRLAYPSLLAGGAGVVVGLMRGNAPRRGSKVLPLLLLLAVGGIAAGAIVILVDRSESAPTTSYDPLSLPHSPPFATGSQESRAPMAHPDCAGVSFSPDGALLASRGGNTVRIWNAATRSQVHALDVGFEPRRVVFVDQSRALVAISETGTMKRFDLKNGAALPDPPATPWHDESPAAEPALFPDGDQLVIPSDRPSKWSISQQKRLGRYAGAPGYCSPVTVSASHVAAWCEGSLVVWDADKPRPLAKRASGTVHEVAISPDGSYLATRTWDSEPGKPDASQRYELFVLKTLERRFSLDFPDGEFKADFAFSADGSRLAVRQTATTVVFVDTESGERIRQHTVPDWGFDLDLSPDGSVLALSSSEIELVDLGALAPRPPSVEDGVAPAIDVPWKLPEREMTERERALMGTWIAKLDAHGTELPMFSGGAIFDMKNRGRDLMGAAEAVMADERIPTGCVWMELREGFRGVRDPCALHDGEPASIETSNLLTGEKTDSSVPFEWYLDGDTLKIHTERELVVLVPGDASKRKLRFRHWHLEILDDGKMKESLPEHDYTLPGRYHYQIGHARDAGNGR